MSNAPTTIPTIRRTEGLGALFNQLGPLGDLPGLWVGSGFNLIARPDFAARSVPPSPNEPHLFLELNFTVEALKFDTIGSPIPNRGFAQADIELFGVHYLQQISDRNTGGALHLEPGIWINVPPTQDPNLPASVTRMASIPHGTTMLASGAATTIAGPPTIPAANTFPFGAGSPVPAPGSPLPGFPEYNLAASPVPATRTPLGQVPGITQDIINDPNSLLRSALTGFTVEQTVQLDVATVGSVQVFQTPQPEPPPTPLPPTNTVTIPEGGGGTDNIAFLGPNADAATVFATFWIETIQDPFFPKRHFMQLQYSQTVFLNFPLDVPGGGTPELTWPHVSVATLQKQF